MVIKNIAKALYAFFGVGFLITGAIVLSVDTGLLPDVLTSAVINAAHGDARALHIIQEFGAFLIFVGLITFWFVRHYEMSKPFHWAMTAAWGFVALAHWFDVRGPFHPGIGAIINSIPFVLFLLVGLLREIGKNGRRKEFLTDISPAPH